MNLKEISSFTGKKKVSAILLCVSMGILVTAMLAFLIDGDFDDVGLYLSLAHVIAAVVFFILNMNERGEVFKYLLYGMIFTASFLALNSYCTLFVDLLFVGAAIPAIVSFIFTFLKDNDVVVVPVVEATTSNASKDAYEQLRKLKEMYDEGILTQEEFEEKKKQYLDNL